MSVLQRVLVIVFIRCFVGWDGRASAPIEWLAMIAWCFEWAFFCSCLLSSEIIFCVVVVNDETIVMFILSCSYSVLDHTISVIILEPMN